MSHCSKPESSCGTEPKAPCNSCSVDWLAMFQNVPVKEGSFLARKVAEQGGTPVTIKASFPSPRG